jgi:hypothetical protein
VLPALDDAAVGQWCRAAVAALSAARGRLDDLNVFPVPDGDTGTNLLATAEAALAVLDESGPQGTEPAWAAMARGAVLGARGNSGTILAQLWRGLADQLADQPPADGPTLAAALQKAADTAYSAVADPEEGTFLTVARAGGEAAVASVARGQTGLGEVVRAAADGARAALEETPGQLAALRDAGVVDAGGAGLCLVLDALVTTVTGVEPARPPLVRPAGRGPHAGHTHGPDSRDLPHQPPAGPGSEVQYLLTDSDEAASPGCRTGWPRSATAWWSSASTPRAGARGTCTCTSATSARRSRPASRPAARTASRSARWPRCGRRRRRPARGRSCDRPGRAGWRELFTDEGATVVPCGAGRRHRGRRARRGPGLGCGRRRRTAQRRGPDRAVLRAAERAREEGRDVGRGPTRSPVQGLAALAVADPARRFGDDVITMAEAAAATRWAEVTVAEHEALTSAGRCAPGDVLGSAEGDVLLIGGEPAAVACELLDRMLSAGGELVTLVVGPDADLAGAVCAHLAGRHPTVEVTRYDGAPEGVPLQVGVE